MGGCCSKSVEAADDLGTQGTTLCVTVIALAIFLALTTAPFWYFIHETASGAQKKSTVALALYILSPIIILIICTCGIVGSFLFHETLLQTFGMVNITLFIFNSVQFIITWLTWRDCEHGTKVIPNSPYNYVCEDEFKDLWYFIPALITILANILCAFCGCFFSKKVGYAKRPPSDSY